METIRKIKIDFLPHKKGGEGFLCSLAAFDKEVFALSVHVQFAINSFTECALGAEIAV